MSSARSQSSVGTASSGALPTDLPYELRDVLSADEWEALEDKWAEKEAESLLQSASGFLGRRAYLTEAPTRRKRLPWNDYFQHVGQDTPKPQPKRRYFDGLCTEVVNGPGAGHGRGARGAHQPGPSRLLRGQRPWVDNFARTVTADNDALHPTLRHYFDRRGFEGSYRQRPGLSRVTQRLPGRTPREKRDPLQNSASLPSLASTSRFGPLAESCEEQPEDLTWGKRCLLFGPDLSMRSAPAGKLPWICDHDVCESVDNGELHPSIRHYFDEEGMETSFRNRGRHYGRPTKSPFGETPEPAPSSPEWRPPACARAHGSTARSSACEAPASEGPALGGPFRSTACAPGLRLFPGLGN